MYELRLTDAGNRVFEGSVKGHADNWRRAVFHKPLSPEEAIILADGGSEWLFEYAGGSFLIQFRGDGFNHFVCSKYPAHSHWLLDESDNSKLLINWDRYGIYEMVIDASSRTMAGCKQGQPANWRRAQFVRSLSAGDMPLEAEHAHDEHIHGDHCGH